MNTPQIPFLNIKIQSITSDDLLQKLDRGVLVTPNIDHLIKLQRDREFYDVYQKAEWVVCDSKVLYLLLKHTRYAIPEPIPGSSFFVKYYNYHRDNPDCKIFLLGAREGVADMAMKRINETCGREIVVGAHSPSFGFEKNPEECLRIIDIINNSGANTVLVGVGAPKQEKWIMTHKDSMPGVKVWMALGATIDFESGMLRRAPKFMQAIGMEWLYRMFCDPKRLIKRYLIDDMKFFYYFSKQLLGIYKNPFQDN